MGFIDQVLKENIEYLMVKYPQTKEIMPNKRLRAEVEAINNLENDVNDIFRPSKIKFTLNKS